MNRTLTIGHRPRLGSAALLGLLWLLSAAPAGAELALGVVQRVEAPRLFRLDGQVEAVNRSTLTAQTAGRVERIEVDVDDYVEQGTEIIVLRSTEQTAAVSRARAALEGTAARRTEAELEFNRLREVFERQLVAKAELDKARSALDSARAAEQAATAALRAAEEQLGYTRIEAPYTGIVTERHIEVGETAQPGTPLISGVSLEKLRVVVDVPQNLVAAIRRAGRAFVEQPGRGWLPASAVTVFPYADPLSNTFKVRLGLDQVQDLFPGMFVKVSFLIGTREALVVPAEAVVFRSEVVGIYLVDGDGRVGFRRIRVGHQLNEGRLVVLSGLAEGDRVALDPIAAAVTLKAQRGEP